MVAEKSFVAQKLARARTISWEAMAYRNESRVGIAASNTAPAPLSEVPAVEGSVQP
jgi:hypothetical protein